MMVTWNIDLTEYEDYQLENLLSIVQQMDYSIAREIEDYLTEKRKLTKDEAIALMQSGVKMTHNWFTSDEWVYIGASGQYVLEDGVECSAFEFWKYRTDESWNTDWSRF